MIANRNLVTLNLLQISYNRYVITNDDATIECTANIHYLQLFYYSFCVFMLSLSLSYINSAVIIFFRDMSQIIGILLQIGVWLTPILWQIDMIKGNLKYIFYLNPIYYVVLGYRDSLIHRAGLFGRWQMAVYFWVVVLVLFILGRKLFKRLQVHFADVL